MSSFKIGILRVVGCGGFCSGYEIWNFKDIDKHVEDVIKNYKVDTGIDIYDRLDFDIIQKEIRDYIKDENPYDFSKENSKVKITLSTKEEFDSSEYKFSRRGICANFI